VTFKLGLGFRGGACACGAGGIPNGAGGGAAAAAAAAAAAVRLPIFAIRRHATRARCTPPRTATLIKGEAKTHFSPIKMYSNIY
jgi:hypothetical protein